MLDDGRALVAGVFTAVNGVPRDGLARLTSSGEVDPDFVPAVQALNGEIKAISVQPDGKVLLVRIYDGTDPAESVLIRLNPDGSRDLGFRPHWPVPVSSASAVALQNDGAILVAVSLATNVFQHAVFRLDSTGKVDPSFVLPGPLSGDPPNGIISQPDGKIVVWGCATGLLGQERVGMLRLNSDGSLDVSFRLNLRPRWTNSPQCVTSARLLANGNFLAFGYFEGGDLFQLAPDGTADIGRGGVVNAMSDRVALPQDTGLVANGLLYGVTASGVLVGASLIDAYVIALAKDQQHVLSSTDGFAIRRYDAKRSLDTSFQTAALQKPGIIGSVLRQPDGRIVISGSFAAIAGVPRPGLARLYPDGRLDLSFVPGTNIPTFTEFVWVLGLLRSHPTSGQIVVAGLPGSAPDSALVRLNADGTRDSSFSTSALSPSETDGPPRFALDLAVQPDGKVVLLRLENDKPPLIIRLLADGHPDVRFQPAPLPFNPQTLAIGTDGRLLVAGGAADRSGSNLRLQLARLEENGSLDTTFSPQVPGAGEVLCGSLNGIAIQPDGKIVLVVNDTMLRFLPDGTWDRSFVRAPSRWGWDRSVAAGLGLGTIVEMAFLEQDGRYDLIPEYMAFQSSFSLGSQRGQVAMPDGGIILAVLPWDVTTHKFGLARLRPAPVIHSSQILSDGTITLKIGGKPNWTYKLERSVDLAQWSTPEEISLIDPTREGVQIGSKNLLPNQFFRVSVRP